MTRRRTVARAIALAAALVASLAACAQSSESTVSSGDCVAVAGPGDASNAVTASGAFGVAADTAFAAPLRAERLEVTANGAGSGDPVTAHGVLTGHVEVRSGSTGEVVVPYSVFAPSRLDGAAAADGAPVTVTQVRDQLPGLADALQCARAGQRITAVMPATTLLGPGSSAQLPDPTASLVAVVDVTRVFPSSAQGVVLPPVDGVPAVVTAPSGQPGVTMPQQLPPTEQRSALRVQGHGPVVEAGQVLTLHGSAFAWETGAELSSTWDASHEVPQLAAVPGPAPDGLYGATSALIGERVGSQVIVIVPAEQAGTLAGPGKAVDADDHTVVLVIDILAADPPGA